MRWLRGAGLLLMMGCSGSVTPPPGDGGCTTCLPPPPAADLLISEVSAAQTPLTPAWLELFNGTDAGKDLSQYVIHSGVLFDDGGFDATGTDFPLGARTLAPGGFIVVSGKPFDDLYENAQLMLAGQPDASLYFTADGGPSFVQLRRNDGGIVDAISFGALAVDGWKGGAAALPSASDDFGRVLARHLERADSDSAADWSICEFSTPAGPNDAFDSTDADHDGLPDSAERPGGTFAGLPLYDWGARENMRDVFVEIDTMDLDGGNGPDPGMVPRVDALDRLASVFQAHGIAMHFDVGGKLASPPDAGAAPSTYFLGGGDTVPWACTISMAHVAGATSFYELKAAHFDLRRRVSFHYVIWGNSIADVQCGGRGASGRSELPGNDVELALGTQAYKDDTPGRLNQVANVQSSTLMHELGHNFGLRHGGFEDANYKPNYLSVMNYLYQLDGLPVIGNAEGDRYYLLYGGLTQLCPSDPPAVAGNASLVQGPGSTAFILDYSNGSSSPLDQSGLDETKGLGRMGSTGVDFNWNGMIDAAKVSASIDSYDTNGVCPAGTTGSGVLKDSDDWSAIVLPFSHAPLGAESGARRGLDVLGDRQPVVIETLVLH